MAHTDTHQHRAGKQSADRGHGSRREPSDARKEQASKDADAGAAPEQSDGQPETVNRKVKRPGPAEK